MLIRHYAPGVTAKLNRPLRIFAITFLVLIIVATIVKERANISEYLTQVGLATALFCILSLGIGYLVPRLLNINSAQARASAFEIGIHNSNSCHDHCPDCDWQLSSSKCQRQFILFLCIYVLQLLALY